MKQKIKIYFWHDRNGDWRWHVKRAGRIIACSGEGYKRQATAMKTLTRMIESFKVGQVEFRDENSD